MLDTRFHGVCEEAAAAWSVPALAVGVDAGAGPEVLALGCGLDTRFRIASVTKPMTTVLALRLLELEASTGVLYYAKANGVGAFGVTTGLFLLFLPALVYSFLAGLWLMRTLVEVARMARR